MRKSLPLAVLVITAGFVPAACGKTEPQVPTLLVDAGFTQADGGIEGGETGAPNVVPSAPGAPPSAPGAPTSSPSAATSASAVSVLAGVDAALDLAVQADAQKDAPGMTAEGLPGRATLAEGATFNMLVTLQPGRCYTIVAMSAPLQISLLEVKLLAPPLFTLEAGRSGASDKNPAVLGRGALATCPASPFALPYRVDVVARKGAGRVAVAVFSRAK